MIDLRSDTVTVPSDAMRLAMKDAVVGDDVMGEDPTVKELEKSVAKLSGKDAGMFVPSGTMSNLIAQLVHCDARHSEVICGDSSHVARYEAGGASQVGGIMLRQLKNQPDGTIDLAEIRQMIHPEDDHFTKSKLLCLENTHNGKGGRILPLDYLTQAKALCQEFGLSMHCDGARIWHAAEGLQQPLSALCEVFDSVSICLSKGLAAPVGSILCGSSDFIKKARHTRKMLGGGMRQVGIVAAGGLFAVNNMRARLVDDHSNAKLFASRIEKLGFKLLHEVESNIVIFDVSPVVESVPVFLAACKTAGVGLGRSLFPTGCRAVLHYGIEETDVVKACSIIASVIPDCNLPQAKRAKLQ